MAYITKRGRQCDIWPKKDVVLYEDNDGCDDDDNDEQLHDQEGGGCQ